MFNSKLGNTSFAKVSTKLSSLPQGIMDEKIISYLSPKERFKMMVAAPDLFHPTVYCKALLLAVLMGDPGAVVTMIRRTSPAKLFEKNNVTDACGQIFYDVSALQLIIFLLDWDMLNQIKPFISENYLNLAYQQLLKMQGGGADLVKLAQDPNLMNFSDLKLRVENGYSFSLLENKDGILYWNGQFFYAHQVTETVTLMSPRVAKDKKPLFNQFLLSLENMEQNSARRTNSIEHDLIACTMGRVLERKGVCYEREGVPYQDTRTDLQVIHAYRKYFRLCDERLNGPVPPILVPNNSDLTSPDIVGQAQKILPIHMLQRFCETNKPFSPLPTANKLNSHPLKRGLQIFNVNLNTYESVLPFGHKIGLGYSYSIHKGFFSVAWMAQNSIPRFMGADDQDLAAICRIATVGKTNIQAFIQECNLKRAHEFESQDESYPLHDQPDFGFSA